MTNRTDTFVRANGAISAGTPSDGGGSWTIWSGTFVVASNAANESGATSQAICSLEASSSSGSVDTTYTGFFGDLGLVGRVSDDSNYMLMRVHSSYAFAIFKKVAGSFTNLAANGGSIPASGDTVKFTIDGSSNMSCYLNGVSQGITATDSFNSTATKWGLRSSGSNIWAATPFHFVDAGGGATLKLFTPSSLNGLGSGGAFFHDRLA